MRSPNASHYADFAVSHHSKITRSFTYFNVQDIVKIWADSGKWWQAAANIIPFHSFLKYNSNLLLLLQKRFIS
jgi:hypothetical protein